MQVALRENKDTALGHCRGSIQLEMFMSVKSTLRETAVSRQVGITCFHVLERKPAVPAIDRQSCIR